MIEYFNEDCMTGMARYPDGYFDLIITSPPYNLGNKHKTDSRYTTKEGKRKPGFGVFKPYGVYDDNMPEDEYQQWQTDILNECARVLANDGSMFYNHKNRIRQGFSITPYEWILQSDLKLKQEIVWQNGGQNFDKCRFYPMTERIYWLAKNKKVKFENTIKMIDIAKWRPVGTGGVHKRAFPVEMVTDILACFPKGLKVLDPFMGSGTTGVACYDMGFDAVGFEIDPVYYEESKARLEARQRQITLE